MITRNGKIYLTINDICKKLNMPESTVRSRFYTKNAKLRWGVAIIKRENGKYNWVVESSNFDKLWKDSKPSEEDKSIPTKKLEEMAKSRDLDIIE